MNKTKKLLLKEILSNTNVFHLVMINTIAFGFFVYPIAIEPSNLNTLWYLIYLLIVVFMMTFMQCLVIEKLITSNNINDIVNLADIEKSDDVC